MLQPEATTGKRPGKTFFIQYSFFYEQCYLYFSIGTIYTYLTQFITYLAMAPLLILTVS
jgi:hypothetical protein